MEEAKKVKRYKRLIFKQFVQFSGLCGPQFLSYLPKRFTHLCRALYGDAMLVHRFGSAIWPPENNENIWSSLFLKKALSFNSRTSIWKLKLKCLYCWKSRGQTFFQRDSIPILVSRTENSEVEIAVFSKWDMLRKWKLVKDLLFVYL